MEMKLIQGQNGREKRRDGRKIEIWERTEFTCVPIQEEDLLREEMALGARGAKPFQSDIKV